MQRLTWLDAAKGLAVLLVVFVHAGTFGGETTPSWAADVNAVLAEVRMPLLIFCAGIVLPRSLEKQSTLFLRGKLDNLVWPWFVWTTVTMLLASGTRSRVLEPGLWLNGTHTWFLSALCVLFCAALVMKRVPLGAMTALYGLAYLLTVPLWGSQFGGGGNGSLSSFAQTVLWAGFYFYLGAAMSRWLGSDHRPLWPVGLVAAAVYLITWWIERHTDEGFLTSESAGLLLSLLGVTAVLFVFRDLPQSGLLKTVEWFGRRSIVVYLVHWPVMLLCRRTAWALGVDIGFWTYLAAGLASAVIGCALYPSVKFLFAFPRRATRRQTPPSKVDA